MHFRRGIRPPEEVITSNSNSAVIAAENTNLISEFFAAAGRATGGDSRVRIVTADAHYEVPSGFVWVILEVRDSRREDCEIFWDAWEEKARLKIEASTFTFKIEGWLNR